MRMRVFYTLDISQINLGMVFLNAKVEGMHFHDIRHEVTCRLYEKTTLSDVLIAKITGHRSLRMLQRYASLRGSDLAPHLW
jgi:integrase